MKRFFKIQKQWFLVAGISAVLVTEGMSKDYNKDEANVGDYVLPDPLHPAGEVEPVATREAWEGRGRAATLALFEQHVYGKTPAGPWDLKFELLDEKPDALGGLATRRLVQISLKDLPKWPGIQLMLYVPNQRAEGPVPTFVGLSFGGNHAVSTEADVPLSTRWQRPQKEKGIVNNLATEASRGGESSRWPVEQFLARGYGLATAYCGDTEADHAEGWRDGLRGALRERDGDGGEMREGEWGCIGAWAWSLSRMLDYLETVPEVDSKRFISFGHSRLGKTSLWAGAQDQRFAMVISNNSGEGGAALKYRVFGETPKVITTSFPHWFTATYKGYGEDPKACPVDQHQLVALMAPRPAYVASAVDDLWADPNGEFLAARESAPVYRLYGMESVGVETQPAVDQPVGERVGYHVRTGGHGVEVFDWEQYMNFADRHLK